MKKYTWTLFLNSPNPNYILTSQYYHVVMEPPKHLTLMLHSDVISSLVLPQHPQFATCTSVEVLVLVP